MRRASRLLPARPAAPLARALAALLSCALLGAAGLACSRGAGAGSAPPEAPPTGTAEPAPQSDPSPDAPGVARGSPLVSRVLLVGLDGATWKLMDQLLWERRMPNLARIVGTGVRADLQTLEPTVSPAIWTTIATGFLPRAHGILGFEGVPGQTMQTLPNSRMRKRKAYWEILSDLGVTTGTVGWWATWPADPLGEGSYLVTDRVPYTRMEASTGRSEIAADDAWPRELLAEVAPLVERPNQIDAEVVQRFLGMGPEEMQHELLDAEYVMGRYLPEFKFVYQSDASTQRIAKHLLATRPVELASVYFTGIDTVSHLYWHFSFPQGFEQLAIDPRDAERFRSVIPLYYAQVDRWIGELAALAGDDATIVIVSDHGFGGTGRLPWSGGHGRLTPGAPIAPPGILAMAGPGIAPGPRRLERAQVLDVAPTLLRLFGAPAARDMRGRVLRDGLAEGDRGVPEPVDSYEHIGRTRGDAPVPVDPAGDADRRERLRALGYIE